MVGKPIEWQIVGVFHNVRGAGFREDYTEMVVPFWQSPWPQAQMAVRTEGDPKSVIKSIAAAVNSVDPDLPLAGVMTVDEIVSESLAIDRFSVVLFASSILGCCYRCRHFRSDGLHLCATPQNLACAWPRRATLARHRDVSKEVTTLAS